MKKILIDVFGSDHPEQLLEGCARHEALSSS